MTENQYYQLGLSEAQSLIKSMPRNVLDTTNLEQLKMEINESLKNSKILAQWKRQDRLPLRVKSYWEGVEDAIQGMF